MDKRELVDKLMYNGIKYDASMRECDMFLYFVVDVQKSPTTTKQITRSTEVITEAMETMMQETVDNNQRFTYWELSQRLTPLQIKCHMSSYCGRLGQHIKSLFKRAPYIRKRDMKVKVHYFMDNILDDITDDTVLDQIYIGWYGWDEMGQVEPVVTVQHADTVCKQALTGTKSS